MKKCIKTKFSTNKKKRERGERIELPTYGFGIHCSTTELTPQVAYTRVFSSQKDTEPRESNSAPKDNN